MSRYRNALPQLEDRLFLTDGGIETTLIFHEGFDLPYFAAFELLKSEGGSSALRKYFLTYAEIATSKGVGLVLESATWRASSDWGDRLGYTPDSLARANRKAIELLAEIRQKHETADSQMVLSGCIGPRGDGYIVDTAMSEEEAEVYHSRQIATFAETAADMVSAITMTNVEESIGITRAAIGAGIPAAISFTVETDGRLPTGQPLGEAIDEVDSATSEYPAYYMINCAHPTHFERVVASAGRWRERIRGLRANASCKSHAELDEATELDIGDPSELARQYARLTRSLPRLNVLGGCCGTDHRHILQIADACVRLFDREPVAVQDFACVPPGVELD